jgi:hypothetical protein
VTFTTKQIDTIVLVLAAIAVLLAKAGVIH